jgi:hypothetical protein
VRVSKIPFDIKNQKGNEKRIFCGIKEPSRVTADGIQTRSRSFSMSQVTASCAACELSG